MLDGVNEIGQFNVVAINLGKSQGMAVGDVLAVFRHGEVIRDTVSDKHENVQLPNERAGELIVFRTFNKVSYGLIMRAQREMQVGESSKTLMLFPVILAPAMRARHRVKDDADHLRHNSSPAGGRRASAPAGAHWRPTHEK